MLVHNGLASSMLVAKRPAGVTPKVNLRNLLDAGGKARNHRNYFDFKTHCRHHLK